MKPWNTDNLATEDDTFSGVFSSEKQDKPKFDLKVETFHYLDGQIEQRISSMGKLISTYVMDTREKQIREALIKLGWTPP